MNIEYTTRQKEAIVSLLIEMANADNKVTLEELHESNVINAELGITDEIFRVGRALALPYAIEVLKQMSDEQKIDVGLMLTRIIDADGEVDDVEIDLLNHICTAAGIDKLLP
ncbi:MAG: TerB family tellurite resistance protein [Muribaculaceae bacterium]|nr:TerB family tellurite resistance protein [Muribaculaceae bacterium]